MQIFNATWKFTYYIVIERIRNLSIRCVKGVDVNVDRDVDCGGSWGSGGGGGGHGGRLRVKVIGGELMVS